MAVVGFQESVGEQVVAGQDGGLVSEERPYGGLAASHVGHVHHVVVYQGGHVYDFHQRCRQIGLVRHLGAEKLVGKQDQHGAELLPLGLEKLPVHLFHLWKVPGDEFLEFLIEDGQFFHGLLLL